MCGLAEGARDAFFLRKDLGDGGVDRQHEEIDFCTRQLSTIYELGSPDMIAEPPKHRTSLARIRLAKPAQLRALEKFLDPKSMGLPDTAYANLKLAEEARYGEEYGTSLLAKALAAYDRSDPGAADRQGTGIGLRGIVGEAVCGDERPPARSRTNGALEKWKAHAREDLEGNTDVAYIDERNTGVGCGQTGIEDESGIHFVARIPKHAACPSIRVRGVDPDSGRQRTAYADRLGGHISCPERLLRAGRHLDCVR